MPKEDKAIEILKRISMFDPETDFDNIESKKDLSMQFHELIMSNTPKAREFFKRFDTGVNDIIRDMGIISKEDGGDIEGEDEVDMSPTPDEDGMEDIETENPNEEDFTDEEDVDLTKALSDSFNYRIDFANRFMM